MQCIFVITDVAGVNYRSFWNAWPLKIEPIGCPKTSRTINLCCVTFQNSEDFIYTRRKFEIIPKMFKKWTPKNIFIPIFFNVLWTVHRDIFEQ
jgi:hypothetical protein